MPDVMIVTVSVELQKVHQYQNIKAQKDKDKSVKFRAAQCSG